MKPDYSSQTLELEHTKDQASFQAWVDERVLEAKEMGCKFPRVTWSTEGARGILFEAWITERDWNSTPPKCHSEHFSTKPENE